MTSQKKKSSKKTSSKAIKKPSKKAAKKTSKAPAKKAVKKSVKKVTNKNSKKSAKKLVAKSSKTALKTKSKNIMAMKGDLLWVAIGASAGGLEALKSFITKLPQKAERDITYIVAQHLSPTHKSMLVELLARETSLKVESVKHKKKPKPNVIYITPPDKDVYVENSYMMLSNPMSEFSPKPSIDLFLSSLAEDQKEKSIAIILSGTSSDGSHGVRAIRAAGGVTISQDIDSAKFDGMPGNAIDTGCIDFIMPPEKMVEQLFSLASVPRNTEISQNDIVRTDIQELLYLLKERKGIDFKDYKTGTLYRRIDRRMTACSTADLEEYLSYVKENPKELDELYDDILICVTSFFRDPTAYEDLNDIIKKILSGKKPGDTIRIWVPGCATGEEAYSLIIAFAEMLGGLSALSNYNVQVFASDIGDNIIARARRGLYSETTLKNLSPKIRQKYFSFKDNGYEISKIVRDLVVFSKHNVFEDPPFLRLDLITCRNLLIYFNAKLQEKVFGLFHYALHTNGYLFLGKSESLGNAKNLFQTIHSQSKIYKKNYIANTKEEYGFKPTYSPVRRIEDKAITEQASGKTVHDLPDAFVEALSPDSILINEDMEIIRIYGDVHSYMQLSAGSVSTNLMSLARKEFRQELRALIYKSLREGNAENILPKKLKLGQENHYIDIIIRPLNIKNVPDVCLLVSFEKRKMQPTASSSAQKRNAKKNVPVIAELEQELASTREHLQTVVEELETSNEELQSTNEELQSSNEELQSSNEELETANEELQSTNEELLTVNDELQIKTNELTVSNEDLINIKDSFDFPLVVVTKELQVKLYNHAASEIFLITQDDTPKAITSFGKRIEIPGLGKNILDVIEKEKPFSRQLDDDDKCYFERILPYRVESGRVEGAILTYVDNTKVREIQNKLIDSEKRYQMAVDGSSVGIWDWDIEKDQFYCSPKLHDLLQIPDDGEVYNIDFLFSRMHPDDQDDIRSILDAHLQKGFEFDVECRLRKGVEPKNKRIATNTVNQSEYIWAHMRGEAVWDSNNNAIRMAGSLNDETRRREMVDHMRDSNEALARFAYVCSHDLKEPARIAQNFSNLLAKSCKDILSEEHLEYLTHIQDNTERMGKMIKDMLTYSQIENKNIVLEKVDCNDEIEKVIKMLQLVIDEKKAQVTYSDLPTLKVDRTQIFQLFQNLVSNALKFCDVKTPKVHVDVLEYKDLWHFTVKDNGIGIDKKYAQQIFDVFKRLNKSEEYEGTGIGLSICQKIVTRHGGKIWVDSMPNKGSVFHFTIPKK